MKGAIQQVGTAKPSEHFAEGYYVYFVYEVGEAKRGEGKTICARATW